ncbi:4-hydroxy-3-methylbut-2-en-1-yl diphosphate synthase [Taibaiella sp. KBW10]|uniref:(E)-4-hydroxy-3-methylbut-2-enyl-diphosphate synthase n=1 Tax=Taibaiella sp. KBW10 TaxID=2153357 RepID=UPI000F597324|nr:(E)-4-hydroxy-3-methylbut-2-enyl-diphosphate synthase [Taibaiella sp. KBW10]RQO31909.1 4-hydroxy-3-methylbut-2-en-1-yl diphosphate synthase [Taibaiella sp. KBW10]
MEYYTSSLTSYKRIPTLEVNVGGLLLGKEHPIRLQTMTTKDTMDTAGSIQETISCIKAGAELVRITAPSKKEAENLLMIREGIEALGYHVPLVADIHYTPNAAEVAAKHIQKVRINPGNYVDKKKFETLSYTDEDYQEELDRIAKKFIPLLDICKEYHTAIRIGTNHGSLSDRIMSRYGDTHNGMVESAMEFLRIARSQDFHNIVISMKSSNPQVMVHAYRLLVKTMQDEFGLLYPLHLGVTEAGDGEDGRIKSAVGIGTLLEDGIGDTVRVSLTENPEYEIPVCRDLVKRYETNKHHLSDAQIPAITTLPYNPFEYKRRTTFAVENIGAQQVPVVIADYSKINRTLIPEDMQAIGYTYSPDLDKWQIADAAADYLFVENPELNFALPGTLKVITWASEWAKQQIKDQSFPIFLLEEYLNAPAEAKSSRINFVMVDCYNNEFPTNTEDIALLKEDKTVVLCLSNEHKNAMQAIRRMGISLMEQQIQHPIILMNDSYWDTWDEHLIHYATECGALLIDGFGDGLALGMKQASYAQLQNQNETLHIEKFLNDAAFGILQATRTRISKTEYISCPSCGRTLFDLQETTAKIRAATHHLKGLKIGIMGCIVNGPGEMADADFGYVGSGVGKITLYKGQEVIKRNVDSEVAVDELIQLIKDNHAWVDKV